MISTADAGIGTDAEESELTRSRPSEAPCMPFDATWIMWELVVGGVGFVLFTYGRKQQRIPQLVTGLLFMLYPIFVSNTVWLVVVGCVLGAGLWLAVRLGW